MVRGSAETSVVNASVLCALLSIRAGRAFTCCASRGNLAPAEISSCLSRRLSSGNLPAPKAVQINRKTLGTSGSSTRSSSTPPVNFGRSIVRMLSASLNNCPVATPQSTKRHSNAFLRQKEIGADDNGPLALVILNTKDDTENKDLLRHLWQRAELRICADGGANRLYDSFIADSAEERARFVPEVIVGDLDSLRPDVAGFYQNLGTKVKLEAGQDHNDFEKCLLEIERRMTPVDGCVKMAAHNVDSSLGDENEGQVSHHTNPSLNLHARMCPATVVGLGAFGGRFDHEMAALSLLHSYTSRFQRLILMGSGNVAFLLTPGLNHIVELDERFEGPTVGLLPVGGACRCVTTEGLKWNLSGGRLEFGVLVSSSNCVTGEEVKVTTDAPLVWTAEFKVAEWADSLSRDKGS